MGVSKKRWFFKFKKFFSTPVFAELQLTQVWLNFETSCFNLKIRGLRANVWVAFLFWKGILILKGIMTFKVKESMLFIEKKVKLNKNET